MNHLPPTRFTDMSPDDCRALVAKASALRRDALAGRTLPLLRGKHFGLATDTQDSSEANLFYGAATGLGAKVARIRSDVAGLHGPNDIRNTAVWLGRLYDAVECQGLPAALVEQLRFAAGVPVFDGIAYANLPSAALAGFSSDDGDEAADRQYLLQALLLGIFA